ncbi:hypothetical protein DDE82_007268 [Stemphylium lycopersici]|nr:hypothetical protein DDE82_007268 [Stemphylium lycopersici]
MRSAIALSVAALTSSALAYPSYGQYQHKEVKNVHVVARTVVNTVYEPVKPSSTSIYVAPPAPTSEAPKLTTTAVYTPAPELTSKVPTTTTATPSASVAPPSSGDTYISIISNQVLAPKCKVTPFVSAGRMQKKPVLEPDTEDETDADEPDDKNGRSARGTYAAAAAVAWPAHQPCEDFSVSPRAAIHHSLVTSPRQGRRCSRWLRVRFQLRVWPSALTHNAHHRTPTSKMNSDSDEQAGVAHDQAPSSPISVNNDSAHSSEMCRGESPIPIEDSVEEPADEPEQDAALQDRPEQNNAVVVPVGGARSARHVIDLTKDCELGEDVPRPMYEKQRFRHFYRVRGKVATGSIASIGLAVIRPPVYAKWFPEYLVVGNLSSKNNLSIRVVRQDRKGNLLPNWPSGGTFFPDSAVVKEFGYFFLSILLELAEDTNSYAISLNKLRAQL